MTINSLPQTTSTTRWQIDPSHSQVELAVKHMMFTTVKGRFTEIEGELVLDEDDITRSSVTANIQAASIMTNDPKRDNHLRSADFLDGENFPAITFTSTRVEPGHGDRLRVIGDLTIRGITREVVLDTMYNGRGVNPYGQVVNGFSAETAINRHDFDLNWNVALEAGGVLVSETVTITLEIQAVKQN